MWVDEGGLLFYLVYEFERLRLLPGLDRSISNNCSSSNRTNNARAGFAPDELLGSGTTQPRPCIISSNTFATDKGQCDRSQATITSSRDISQQALAPRLGRSAKG